MTECTERFLVTDDDGPSGAVVGDLPRTSLAEGSARALRCSDARLKPAP
jgi:hypothetical protein